MQEKQAFAIIVARLPQMIVLSRLWTNRAVLDSTERWYYSLTGAYRESPLQPEHTVYQRMLCDQRLCKLTNEMCDGRLLTMGGCGYNQTILGQSR